MEQDFLLLLGRVRPVLLRTGMYLPEVEKLGREKKLGKIQRIIIKGKSSSGEPQYNDNFVFDAHGWNMAFPKITMTTLLFCTEFVVGTKGDQFSLKGKCLLQSHTLKMKETWACMIMLRYLGFIQDMIPLLIGLSFAVVTYLAIQGTVTLYASKTIVPWRASRTSIIKI